MYREKPWILGSKLKNEPKRTKTRKSYTKQHFSEGELKCSKREIEKIRAEAIQNYKKEVLKMKSIKIFGWKINISHV